MRPRIAVVLIALTCVAVLAWPTMGDPPKAKPGPDQLFTPEHPRRGRDKPAPQDALREMQMGLRVAHQMVEVMDNPLLSSQIAIMRIKDMAVKGKRLERGVSLLRDIANEADHPPVRRAALFAVADLHEAAGNAAEAMEALVSVCLPRPGREHHEREEAEGRERACGRRDGPKMPDDAREVCRWLREHPDLARRIIGAHFADAGAPRPGGQCDNPRGGRCGETGPCRMMGMGARPGSPDPMPQARPKPGPRDICDSLRQTVEMLRHQLAVAAERAGRPPQGPLGPGVRPGPHDPDERASGGAHAERQGDELREHAERLDRAKRELDEKARHLDRMHEELKRRARELEEIERRRRQRRDDDD